MSSYAAQKYTKLVIKARYLQSLATDPRIRPISHEQADGYYHAALAAYVAAWEAYLEQLVSDFYFSISKPSSPHFQSLYVIAKDCADGALAKFNTPNFENSRALLTQFTGYDPYSDWIWPRRSMGVFQVNTRLTEILKVRHSFAHGFSMPPYSWNSQLRGKCRLTRKSMAMVDVFFQNLVARTDRGMQLHILHVYGIAVVW